MTPELDVSEEFGLCGPADLCVMDRECVNFGSCTVTMEETASADSD